MEKQTNKPPWRPGKEKKGTPIFLTQGLARHCLIKPFQHLRCFQSHKPHADILAWQNNTRGFYSTALAKV